MRNVLSFAAAGIMLLLVACPQQRIPMPVPINPPTLEEPVNEARAIKEIKKQPVLNPGGITFELVANDAEIEKLSKDSHGVDRFSIHLQTDELIPWNVKVGAEGVNSSDIMLASFPSSPYIDVSSRDDDGWMKVQWYSYKREYKKDQKIEPFELYIVARNKRYCKQLVEDNMQGNVSVEGGVAPDVPERMSDCDKMNDGNFYNFDQKIRLQLLVVNKKSERRKAQEAYMERLICSLINRTKKLVINKITSKWTESSNDVTQFLAGLISDVGNAFLDHRLSLSGYDCAKYQARCIKA